MHVSATCALVLLVATAVAAMPHHQHMPEELSKMFEGPRNIIKRMCLNSTDASPEMLMMLHEGKFDQVQDNKTKCFMHCVLQGMGMIKEGRPDLAAMEAVMEKMMPPPMAMRARKALDNCKDTKGMDPCDTALQFFKCTANFDKEAVTMF